MAIALNKTIRGTAYSLYIKTAIVYVNPESIGVSLTAYQSEGHFQDDFLPIISKKVNITARSIIDLMNAFYPGNISLLIQGIENYLITSVSFFQGGSVVG